MKFDRHKSSLALRTTCRLVVEIHAQILNSDILNSKTKSISKSWCIPNLNSMIPTSRGDALAIRRPGDCIYIVGMAFIGKRGRAIGSIPNLNSVIIASGGDALAIRRPGDCVYNVGMAFIGKRGRAIGSIPNLDSTIQTSRGDALAIRRPGDSTYNVGMSINIGFRV